MATVIALAVLGGAVWTVYVRSVGGPFIFDDEGSVVTNPTIRTLWPLAGDADHPGPLNPPHQMPVAGRPLVNLSFALNYHFSQLNPNGYRVLNICLHMLSAWLLFAIVQRILRLPYFAGQFDRASAPLALVVALVWAVHPLQTESVVYVTQRTELMVGLFYFATVYGAMRYWAATTPLGRAAWLGVAVVASLCGMASKEVMVSAPVVVLLIERTLVAGSFGKACRRSWPLYVGLAVTWGLLLVLNWGGPRGETAGFGQGVSAFAWWLIQSKVLWMYLKLAVWPWPLAVHYEMPYLTFAAAWPWLLGVFLLVIGTLILVWRNHPVGVVGATVLIILAPTLIVPIITEVAAERRMYLPLAALTALVVVGGYWLIEQAAGRFDNAQTRERVSRWLLGTATGLVVVLVLAAGIVSARRLEVYRDDLTLWQETVATQPNDPVAHNSLGVALAKRGQTQQAIEHYRRALELRPLYPEAYNNLGSELSGIGEHQQGLEQLQRGLQLKPESAALLTNVGRELLLAGQPEQAVNYYQRALEVDPNYVVALYNLGILLAYGGQPEQASEYLKRVLELRPDHAEAHVGLAYVLAITDHLPEATAHFEQADELRPANPKFAYHWADVLLKTGHVDQAITVLRSNVGINPDSWANHVLLAGALRQSDKLPEAIEHYEKAVRIDPNDLTVYPNLADAYMQANQPAKAHALMREAVRIARSQGQTELADKIEAWLAKQP